ncbi:hypothetical protein E4U43_002456 [Claviceps pusilla]|uniref:DNA polymerase V n=1 Tax=Claviceps pusilla TaxID=123648 RepID=A0A9P7N8L9_9HYPO|nr:hypothetical protein E4U43_002456 [Claviceps pusilla]
MAGKRKRGGKDGGPGSGANSSKKPKKEMMAIDLSSNCTPTLQVKAFVETPTGDDRKREAELYEMLGSVVEEVRNDAAECIVSSLLEGDGAPEAILERHLSRRLFRGLASGREGSRLGFSLVITEVLSQLFGECQLAETKYTGLTFDKVIGLLAEKTKSVGNVSGQEERDHHLGQVFGLECFVKSKTLFKDVSRWHAVLDMLLKLCHKKIWLRPQCGWILVQALEQMTEDVTKATLAKVAGAALAQTPEGVAAWIVSLNRYPGLKIPPWRNPLSNKSLGDLAAVLKESFKDSAKDPKDKQNGAKHASWSAQLHFVWDLILARFLSAKSDPKEEDFDQFWCRVVDDGLFSKQATDGQKFKGFMVFEKMLKGFAQTPSKLESLFSRNFMSCLLNQAAKEDRYLNRAATKALKAIEEVVSSHPDALAPILANLLGKNGAYAFDQRSSSKTVDKILQNINEHNVESVLAVVKRPIKLMKKQEVVEAQATVRTYADYLAKILNAFASSVPTKNDKSDKPAEGKSAGSRIATGSFDRTLQELTNVAYGQPAEIPKDALTDQIREMCRSRLETSLAKLARASTDFAVFCKAVASIDSSAMTMTDEIKKAKDEALTRMRTLLKSKIDAAQGLAMLHAISIFQLYNEDPDAMDVLDDLSQCYDKLRSAGNATGEGSSSSSSNQGGSELLVEILLSMIARPSSLMRQVSQQVFGVFTRQMSEHSMELLTGPLGSDESTKGQRELFNTEDDAMEIESDASEAEEEEEDDDDKDGVIDVEDASDFEIDSNLEFVDVNGDDEDSEEQDEDEDEDEDEDDDDDDDDDDDENEDQDDGDSGNANTKTGKRKLNQDGEWDNPEELDNILGKILKSHRLDKDAEAESSDDEGDMSDAQMFALDQQLSAAIAPRIKANKTDTKKQKKDAKQSVVNFKHRVLDLVDIYVKNEPLHPLTFSTLLPLLNLMRTTSTKALANRAYEVILNLRKAIKKARASATAASSSTIDEAQLLPLLRACHDEAGKDDAQAYAKAASAASLIVAAAMFRQQRGSIERIAGVYAQTESAWVLHKAKMHSCFFKEWHEWALSMRNGS